MTGRTVPPMGSPSRTTAARVTELAELTAFSSAEPLEEVLVKVKAKVAGAPVKYSTAANVPITGAGGQNSITKERIRYLINQKSGRCFHGARFSLS